MPYLWLLHCGRLVDCWFALVRGVVVSPSCLPLLFDRPAPCLSRPVTIVFPSPPAFLSSPSFSPRPAARTRPTRPTWTTMTRIVLSNTAVARLSQGKSRTFQYCSPSLDTPQGWSPREIAIEPHNMATLATMTSRMMAPTYKMKI
jgi:hypothetical protein